MAKYNIRMEGVKPPENVQKLIDWATETNIAADKDIDQSKLEELGQSVVSEYEIDLLSRSKWEKNTEKGLKLASMVANKKDFPYQNASNIVYPLVAQAVTQFASRTLPSLAQDGQAVKVKIIGEKTEEKLERAASVADHMSYQLTEQIENWMEDTDALLHYYGTAGIAFRKIFWNVEEDMPAAIFLRAEDVIVHYHAKSLEKAKRITHKYEITPNELVGRQRRGEYLDIELGEGDTETKDGQQGDSQNPYLVLEQSRWADLDDDGYLEPYNVFVHKASKKVLRITARWEPDSIDWNDEDEITYIKPECFYVKYQFMPAFDGSFYGMGYGHLIGHPNKAINAIINQMTDAGTLQNTGGGFISEDLELFGKNQKSGKFIVSPGEYMIARDKGSGSSIKDKIVPFNFQGPSLALFQLLGLILEGSERLGQAVEVLSGEAGSANQPAATTLALIEQATKFYTAVKVRLYKSLREEYRKIFTLNRRKLQDLKYNRVLDEQVLRIARADYEEENCDVVPVADPKEATDAQKLIKAQALREFLGQPIRNARERKAALLYLQALQIEDAEDYLPSDKELGQIPPELQVERDKMIHEERKLTFDERKFNDSELRKIDIEERKVAAEILNLLAGAVKHLAEAEAKEIGSQMDEYRANLDTLKTVVDFQTNEEQKRLMGGNGGQAASTAGAPQTGTPATVGA